MDTSFSRAHSYNFFINKNEEPDLMKKLEAFSNEFPHSTDEEVSRRQKEIVAQLASPVGVIILTE